MSSPAFVIQVPLLSALSAEDEELKYLAELLHNKPWTADDMRTMKDEHVSWKEAYDAFVAELKESSDEMALRRIQAMSRMESSTNESLKREYEHFKQNAPNPEIKTLDWPSLCLMADPVMMTRVGMAGGMKSCCWNCAKRNCELLVCAKCKKAQYCSRECQTAAWWHHKRTVTGEYACIPKPTSK